jgi:hypothetical protein
MPGSGLVVVETKFILRGLKAVLNRPAVTLDTDQCFDRSSCRTPRREVGKITGRSGARGFRPSGAAARPTWAGDVVRRRSPAVHRAEGGEEIGRTCMPPMSRTPFKRPTATVFRKKFQADFSQTSRQGATGVVCSRASNRPWRSRVSPLAQFVGSWNSDTPMPGAYFMRLLLWMSLNSR